MAKNKFQLNKGGDHNFDISKGGKRKFDLTKDDDENITTVSSEVNVGQPSGGCSAPKTNKWIWILAAIIVIALLALLLKPKSSEPQIQTDPDSTNQPSFYDETDSDASEGNVMTAEDTPDASPDAPQEVPSINDESVDAPQNSDAEEMSEDNITDQYGTPNKPEMHNTAIINTTNDIEAEALKVIRGEYGDGNVRKDLLGEKYYDIQRRVNELKRQGVF